MRHLVLLCWGAALLQTVVLFAIGQLLVADSLNPLLNLMHELRLPPLEIIPSPNALEETFVQALEISHAAA